MNRHNIRGKYITALMLGFIVALFLIRGFFFLLNDIPYSRSIKLIKGWSVSNSKGQYYRATDKEIYSLYEKKEGKVIIFSITLPRYSFSHPILLLSNLNSEMEVYIDNKIIYYYDFDKTKPNKEIGDGNHRIPLPKDAAGERLRIVYKLNEAGGDFKFKTPVLGDGHKIFSDYIKKNSAVMQVSIFLMIIGMFSIVIGVFSLLFSKHYWEVSISGVISFFCGVYLFSSKDLIQIFSDDLVYNNKIEYMSFYLIALFVFIFMEIIWKPDLSNFSKVLFHGTFFSYVVLFVISLIKEYLDISHLEYGYKYFIALDFILIIEILFFAAKSILKDNSEPYKKAASLSMTAMVAIFILYLVNKLLYPVGELGSHVFSAILNLCYFTFSSFVLMTHILRLIDYGETEMKSNYSEMIKKVDFLTGLNNRVNFISEMENVFMEDRKVKFIMFELSGWWEVNKVLGHSTAEQMLKIFAEILTKTFNKKDIIGRLGDYKFGVLVELSDSDVDYAKKWQSEVSKINNSVYPFYLYVKYAEVSSEIAKDAHSLYFMACKKLGEQFDEPESVVKDMAKLDFERIERIIRAL